MNLKEAAINFARKLDANLELPDAAKKLDLKLTDAAKKRLKQLASTDHDSSLEIKFLGMPKV